MAYLAAMGAWGHGTFENDTAADWLGDLAGGDPSLVAAALTAAADTGADDYLDADDCCPALAAAELVAASAGKGEDRLNKVAKAWFDEHRAAVAKVDIALARRAVERIFRASELTELWAENGPDTAWHTDVRELLRRLGA